MTTASDGRTRWQVAIAISALVALVSAQAEAQTQYKGPPIKIGILNDQAGLYSDISGKGGVWAAEKAVEDFGAAAKGMKVEIVSGDHQNKPDVGASIARKWWESEGVDLITDVGTSSVGLSVNEVARGLGKAYINVGSATSDLTGKSCAPTTIHMVYDTWMLAHGTGTAIVKQGGKNWFFVTADYAFGHALERDTAAVVKANGGTVIGDIKAPLGTQDFSSFMLQAQASKAQVIGLANAGGDTINAIKTAGEFGITKAGQKLAGLLVFISDIHSLGLKTAQGLTFTVPWYWDLNETTRKFGAAFGAANGGRRPTFNESGNYSAVYNYLRAVLAVGSPKDGKAVIDKMKEIGADDPLYGKGPIRADGRVVRDVYLVEVKKPEESKYPWDYYKILAKIPASEAWRPLNEGGCPLVK